MPKTTPFHPRTSALCTSYAWKEWAGHIAVSNFDRHSEREYFAVRHTAGLLDVSPLHKYEVKGPDAGRLLARLWTRDISKIRVGSVVYGCMCDEHGEAIDDGTVGRIGKNWYRMSTSEPWLHWLHRHARGYDVSIEDSTERIGALALQGPLARKILNPLIDDFDLNKMRFFKIRNLKLAGMDVQVSRTGYTGDLGYEIWVDRNDALAVWDAIIEEGHPHGLEPFGLDALDVLRIEAGFVLQGIDYRSARACVTDFQKFSPYEIGLGKTVDLEREEPFIGMHRLIAEQRDGQEWDIVGLELDWAALERMHQAVEVPPHLAPTACRIAVPLFDAAGDKQVGQVTSTTWSPMLKKYLGIAQIEKNHGDVGTELRVEYTVDFYRDLLPCAVVKRPFFDPERKTITPGRAAK